MDERLRQSTSERRAARSPHASCPYSGAERRELPAQAIEGKTAARPSTRRRGHCSCRSRNRRNHHSFLKAASAPAAKSWPSPPGRPRCVLLYAHVAKWPVFATPRWPTFTPPLTGDREMTLKRAWSRGGSLFCLPDRSATRGYAPMDADAIVRLM